MTIQHSDPIVEIAERVTYCFSQSGYAFIEDDKVDALAVALTSFLQTEGIPVHSEAEACTPQSLVRNGGTVTGRSGLSTA
jgi:hypothetical protein